MNTNQPYRLSDGDDLRSDKAKHTREYFLYFPCALTPYEHKSARQTPKKEVRRASVLYTPSRWLRS